MERHEFQVPDVSCQHCVTAIESGVGGVAGVRRVTVDLERKAVDVEGEFDPQEVVAAIVEAGYEVTTP